MAEWCQTQACPECGSSDMDYDVNNATPFHFPHWERKNKPKVHRPKFTSYFPLDPRKHPVSVLHEYCSMQSIQPTFEFYEIPQKVGIEYGCVTTVENFVGEGRAFSKKTAKHQAAIDLLRKLAQPNYLGDDELGSRRFVSETGIVSVHYNSVPKRRSCFRNKQRMTPPPSLQLAKRVKWQDSGGENEVESINSSLEDLNNKSDDSILQPLENSENVKEDYTICLKASTEIEIEVSDNEEMLEQEGRFKSSSAVVSFKKEIQTNKVNEENQDLIDEISEYLSERLRKTSIKTKESNMNSEREDFSSDEIKVIELNDVTPKKKKKKRSYALMMDGSQTLGRKSCLKEVNPIGYLQEACTYFHCDPPSYNFYREGSLRIRAVCTLLDSSTEVFGETKKDAKRMAAVLMIRQLGW